MIFASQSLVLGRFNCETYMLGKFGKSPVLFSQRIERERTLLMVGAGLSLTLVAFTIILLNARNANQLQASQLNSPIEIQANNGQQHGTVLLLTPDKTITSGVKLSRDMLREIAWPATQLPAGAIKARDEFKMVYAKTDLVPGVPLLESNTSIQAPLSALTLTPGNRAVSIDVDETSSIEGHALPGTHVDVVLTGFQGATLLSTVIVQNARIISSGGDTTQVNEMPNSIRPRLSRTISLEVSPQDALKIQTARQMGRLGLMMRAAEDVATTTLTQVTSNDVQGSLKAEAAQPAPACNKGRMRMAGKEYLIGCGGALVAVE